MAATISNGNARSYLYYDELTVVFSVRLLKVVFELYLKLWQVEISSCRRIILDRPECVMV
jgi:hypothetical protein